MTAIDAGSYLQRMVGARCEAADTPYGSIVHFDLGPLGNRPNDGPEARKHGEYCLTIQCPWRLADHNRVICDWNAEGGGQGEIARAVAGLVGTKVVAVTIEGPSWDLRVRFSDGTALHVFSDTDPDDDAWFLLGIDGVLVKARPTTEFGGGVVLTANP